MINLFIRLLAAIGFKKALTDYVYQHQSKSYKEYLEFAFADSNGKKYYRFNALENMPLTLLEQLTILQMKVESRIKGTDLDEWIKASKKVISDKSPSAISDLGYMLGALEERRKLLFDPVLMMEIAALLYIREDENPALYSKDLHREKFIQFEKDKAGGLYDFFQSAGLSKYMPSISFTPLEWEVFLRNQLNQIKNFKETIGKIGTLKSA